MEITNGNNRRLLSLISGPLLFALLLTLGGTSLQLKMIAVAVWMLSWWVTNVLPIGVTALLPIVLFPLLGIMDLKSTTANYANPVIYLFFGGFVLGLAIEKWNLHKRIAINILRFSGNSPNRIILGSMLATALLSMWISNTATTVMMLPIGMSIIGLLQNDLDQGKSGHNFAITLLMGLAFAANIGGMTTLIGTPPNLVLASMLEEIPNVEINFSNWFLFALPLVIVLFTIAYLINVKLIFPVRIRKLDGAPQLIKAELQKLGKLRGGEFRVMIVFIVTALLWIFRSIITEIPALSGLSDPIIAVIAAVALFALPAGEQRGPLLKWKDTERLPWGILLLFGGGLALADGLKTAEIVDLIGQYISSQSSMGLFGLVLIITAFSVFLTEAMSNVALVSVFIPVSLAIASGFGLDGSLLAVPLTLGASCAFMLPIATPPNAIVFSSRKISIREMAMAGILLNLACTAIIAAYSYWLVGRFF